MTKITVAVLLQNCTDISFKQWFDPRFTTLQTGRVLADRTQVLVLSVIQGPVDASLVALTRLVHLP